jgi:NAD(P)-dependent dehydrogenase (short-subunit alcohol dehydrogenase family)
MRGRSVDGIASGTGRSAARAIAVAATLGAAGLVLRLRRRAKGEPLAGRVAVVVGGSRGLGLAIARELIERGCRVAICGRDEDTVERAREDLLARAEIQGGTPVVAGVCDATDEVEVARFLELVLASFGGIDVLVTVAATIRVGAIETASTRDFHEAMESIFWTSAYPTLAVLPLMRRQRGGRIAHVTSIGGRIAVPHLVPYSAAKFAEIGFSEGLRAEVARDGISVTTIVPWLMRTGSHLHARFAGGSDAEYAWFGLGSSTPLALDPTRAARRIVNAMARGERQLVLGLPAKLALRVHGLWPTLTFRIMALASRLLPRSAGDADRDLEGVEIAQRGETAPVRAVRRLAGQDAARYHQM